MPEFQHISLHISTTTEDGKSIKTVIILNDITLTYRNESPMYGMRGMVVRHGHNRKVSVEGNGYVFFSGEEHDPGSPPKPMSLDKDTEFEHLKDTEFEHLNDIEFD